MDTLSFTHATNCEIWNNMVFLKLFNYLPNSEIDVKLINVLDKKFLVQKSK